VILKVKRYGFSLIENSRGVKQEVNGRKKEIQWGIVFGQSIKDSEIGMGQQGG